MREGLGEISYELREQARRWGLDRVSLSSLTSFTLSVSTED